MPPQTKGVVDNVLAHYGVLGMRWGVRRQRTANGGWRTIESNPSAGTPRARQGRSDIQVKQTRSGRVKARGGSRAPASEDAVRRRVAQQQVKRSSTDSLSNADLQALVKRMNLEVQYKDLSKKQSPAKAFVANLLGQQGKQAANRAANDQISAALQKAKK